jgi:carbon-monoxide dehydrogenase small subunit
VTSAAMIDVSFRLNGQRVAINVPADMRLSDILRDGLELTASKVGCAIGRCGACLLLKDGLPVNGCLLMAWQLHGADIVSPEGLAGNAVSRIVQAALAAENAFQCGYCAPGFVVALTALLTARPDAGRDEIVAALEGNLCRCTGYHSIIRGALAAAAALNAAPEAARPGDSA